MSAEQDATEYEYRVQARQPAAEYEPAREWRTVITGRGGGRPYRTLGAAKGVLTRERDAEERRRRWSRAGDAPTEFRVQRRPVSVAWEDVVTS